MTRTPRTDYALRKAVEDWGRGEYADAHIIEDLTDFCKRLETESEEMFYRMRRAEAHRDRSLEILGHIYALHWPDDMKLEDGRTMQFAPNLETTQMFLRGLWKAIREIPEKIEKAKNDAKA